jgi:hypothetical protein
MDGVLERQGFATEIIALQARAERARRLARAITDPRAEASLLELAEECERRLLALEMTGGAASDPRIALREAPS